MTQVRLLWKCIFLFLTCLLAASCLAASCARQPSAQVVSAPTPTTPLSIFESPISPLPTPTTVEVTPKPTEAPVSPVSTSLPTMGTVKGVLLDQATGKPTPDQILYLAKLLKSTEGELRIAALDPAVDPRAHSDEKGDFTFTNIPPDTYALGLATPLGPVLIQIDGQEIICTVEEGKTVELGSIYIRLDF